MTRSNFGGSDTQALAILPPSVNGAVVKAAPNITTGTAWSAETGGTQYTDLILPGGGACLVRTDADGFVRAMQGPDGVNEGLWVDLGSGTRFYLRTTDPLATVYARQGGDFGFPCSMDPAPALSATSSPFTDRAYFYRAIGSGAISKIGLEVQTSLGNVEVGVVGNSGTGRGSLPNAAVKATSGVIACPAAGYTEISLGATITVAEGDWFFISPTNTGAAFYGAGGGPRGGGLVGGRIAKKDGVNPLASPVTGATTEVGPVFLLIGVA